MDLGWLASGADGGWIPSGLRVKDGGNYVGNGKQTLKVVILDILGTNTMTIQQIHDRVDATTKKSNQTRDFSNTSSIEKGKVNQAPQARSVDEDLIKCPQRQ